jgi:2-oxoglutarate ferredoxin oxidoreductase subunit beta
VRPEVVALGSGASEADLFVHNEQEDPPTLAYMLAHMGEPEFPVPLGVFRCVERPTYEDNLYRQMEDARAKSGTGDLDKLLAAGDTWTVT